MNSPFSDYTKRLFVCFGERTQDRFLTLDGQNLQFDEFLFTHLKGLGYERVIFFSHKGLYFYDSISWELTMAGKDSQKQEPPKTKPSQGMAPGPGGVSLRPKQAKNSPTPNSNAQYRYPNFIQLTEINEKTRNCLLQKEIKTAIIFYSEKFTGLRQDTAAVNSIQGLLENELLAREVDNENIVIFVFPLAGANLKNYLQHKPWQFLFTLDQEGKLGGIAEHIFIGPAGKDEIRALFLRYALMQNLAINWQQFNQLVHTSASWVKENNLSLSTLEKWLRDNQRSKNDFELNTENLSKLVQKDIEQKSAWKRLQELQGLEEIKNRITKNLNFFKKWQKQYGQKNESTKKTISRLDQNSSGICLPREINLHLLLAGNPGTGKTTVANLIGEIYRDAGILEIGHTVKVLKDDLEAGYVGQTALKTREKINRALGGILFIDEAYSLVSEHSYGQEAINTILEAMSAQKGQFAVIAAGYPDDMQKFLNSNDGFASRFAEAQITIEDFKPEVLEAIFRDEVQNSLFDLQLDTEVDSLLPGFFHALYDDRDTLEQRFGNARTVKEEIFSPIQLNLDSDEHDQAIIGKKDFPQKFQRFFELAEAPQDMMQEFEELIGLDNVKEKIQSLVIDIEQNQERAKITGKEYKMKPGHYIFSGPPGTGKTTVAKIFGRQLKHLGLVQKSQPVEIKASNLIQDHVGGSGQVVQQALNKALGGVLFIDEAHQLANNSFGQEVVNNIVPFLDEHEDEFAMIIAGYEDKIKDFIKIDDGLERRFKNRIKFSHYSDPELEKIFMLKANQEKMIVSHAAGKPLLELFNALKNEKPERFGNAGKAIEIFEKSLSKLNKRISKRNKDELTVEHRTTILKEDIPYFTEVCE